MALTGASGAPVAVQCAMTAYSEVREVVHVCYHQFFLTDPDFLSEYESTDLLRTLRTNGLIDKAGEHAAVLHTGIHTGVIEVVVQLWVRQPNDVDLAWDDIAEITLSPPDDIWLQVLMDDVPAAYPVLIPGGGGPHRVRAHARGRDTDIDGVADEPFEQYLVQIWPEQAPRADVIHKATDEYGRELRMTRTPAPVGRPLSASERAAANLAANPRAPHPAPAIRELSSYGPSSRVGRPTRLRPTTAGTDRRGQERESCHRVGRARRRPASPRHEPDTSTGPVAPCTPVVRPCT